MSNCSIINRVNEVIKNMSKGKFSYAFKVATTICCLIGLLTSFIGTNNIMSTLSYYTTLSNIVVLIFYISICLILPFKKNADKTQSYAQIKGAVVMIILEVRNSFVKRKIRSLRPDSFLCKDTNNMVVSN